ncbi:hypothetical protein D9613_006027 [Agrocybe pediades]|uniref:Uncharacterized protein n=1 Tax=Agrocybe pediades TaxID=84607 RepID=A0A8H4QV40_9AGAR|nr:hypothetical protein D9613_006027 [Agrocybe pediades]
MPRSAAKKPVLSSLVDLFTLMANTPVVEPESVTRPNTIPLKTFRTSTGPSFDFISRECINYSPPNMSHTRHFSLSSLCIIQSHSDHRLYHSAFVPLYLVTFSNEARSTLAHLATGYKFAEEDAPPATTLTTSTSYAHPSRFFGQCSKSMSRTISTRIAVNFSRTHVLKSFPSASPILFAGKVRTRSYETDSSAPKPTPAIPYGPGIPPPLKGIRILDLTRVLAGPTATMLLADLGADVIKVEEVSRGDDTRSWHPPSAPLASTAPKESKHLPPESAYFLAVNRNKRSITVNIKTPEGLEIIRKLVKTSDILVENFVSGKLASMGLGWEDCYGQTGPYRTAAGYDVIIEAEAGLMHITGEPDRPPAKVGVAATDIATGLYAHGAIMAALLSRQQTGKGVWIDCNLFESQIAGLANIASNYLIAGKEASRHGTAHPSIVPYQVFPCKDGFIMIGIFLRLSLTPFLIQSPSISPIIALSRALELELELSSQTYCQWENYLPKFKTLAEKVLEDPSLATNPKFAMNDARVENRAELLQIITDALMKHDKQYWLERFTGLGVPFGPINNIKQTFEHPQAIARKVTVEVEHARAGKIKLVGPAVTYNGQKMEVRLPPPWLSEHTEEVMEELGYNKKEIAELRKKEII